MEKKHSVIRQNQHGLSSVIPENSELPLSENYLPPGSVIFLDAWTTNQVGILLQIRYITADGVMKDTNISIPLSKGSQLKDEVTVDLGGVFLVSMTASITSGSSVQGESFIIVGRRLGKNTDQLFLSDYISTNIPVGWPNSDLQDPTSQSGAKKLYVLNPGGTATWSKTISSNLLWRILGIYEEVDGSQSSEYISSVIFQDRGGNVYGLLTDTFISDSISPLFNFYFPMSGQPFGRDSNNRIIPFAPDTFLIPGGTIASADASDGRQSYNTVNILVEEWIAI